MRKRILLPLVIVVLSAGTSSRVQAQHAYCSHPASAEVDSASARFLEKTCEATRRYKDHSAAIAAGYRLIGPDMPNMGEHWIHPRLAIRRKIDPSAPAVLTYVPVAGELVLTGVAYAVPVRAGEDEPEFPLTEAAWHYHAGTLEEEVIGHRGHASHGGEHSGARLAMVHAWIWTENPDGLFTADNWALSLVRLGLPIPDTMPPAAAKALFLIDGGVSFYMQRAAANADLTDQDRAALRRALSSYRGKVQATLDTHAGSDVPLESLARHWRALWQNVRRSVSSEAWKQLSGLAGH